MGLGDLIAALESLPPVTFDNVSDVAPSEYADELAELESVFTKRLPAVFPGWESRKQQIAMARTVMQAMLEGKTGLVEAGTGTGKSLALLAPAVQFVRQRGGPVVVSTGTHVLQEQYVEKDVPTLQKALGDFKVSVAKGRGNYLCYKRLNDEAKQLAIGGNDPIGQIERWADRSTTGDRAELPQYLAEHWAKVNADDSCTGAKCPFYEACFFYQARRKQAKADIVVANHALLMADMVVREASFGNASLLPTPKAIVIDEAHHLESAARQGFGIQLTPMRLRRLLGDARRVAPLLPADVVQHCHEAHDEFFDLAAALMGDDRAEISLAGHDAVLRSALLDLETALQNEQSRAKSEQESNDIENLISRLDRYAQDVYTLANPGDNYVVWAEQSRGQARFTTIQATPVDVATALHFNLFEGKSVICSSATMTTNKEFGYFRKATGAPKDTLDYVTDSPFDYERQSLLYIPFDLPDPKVDDYHEQIAPHVVDVLRASSGRAFVLSTSWRGMRTLFDAVSPHLDHRCLAQGEVPRHLLLDAFREDKHSVLFATASFWEGVDVQGEALSAVIVDRLPFAAPTDPVTRAKVRAIEAAGGNAFADYSLPEAVLRLRQGFGRLIRNQSDRGVVAIMDRRIVQSRYGRVFLNSLPPARMVRRIGDVERFFGEGTA